MSTHVVPVEFRDDKGKGASRRLRREEMVPAILYGGTLPPRSLQISQKLALLYSSKEWFYTSVLDLTVGNDVQKAVLRDIQRHPYKKRVLHLDIDCGVDREPVSPIPETPQQPALACRIGGELLAGARKDDDDDDEEDERTGRERTVTARLVDNLIPGYAIPAIIQAETRWGTVVTRLVEMTVR